jgi:hypothetical protein
MGFREVDVLTQEDKGDEGMRIVASVVGLRHIAHGEEVQLLVSCTALLQSVEPIAHRSVWLTVALMGKRTGHVIRHPKKLMTTMSLK